MTSTSAIIEETIRLQRQTGILQFITLGLIFLSNIFILLSVINIRKATRNLKNWQDALTTWQKHLNSPTVEDGDAQTQQGADHAD